MRLIPPNDPLFDQRYGLRNDFGVDQRQLHTPLRPTSLRTRLATPTPRPDLMVIASDSHAWATHQAAHRLRLAATRRSDGSEPVTVEVLNPVRTLIEKLLILHDAATEGDDQRKRITARHYYDTHRLLHQFQDELNEDLISKVVTDVATHSADAGLPVISRPEGGLAVSPAFNPAANPIAASSYEDQVLKQLVWPKAEKPSFEECCNQIRSVLDRTGS